MLNPVPAVLITSKDRDDNPNVFTVGWIGCACTKPPILSVAIRAERLSYENIKASGEFVVNLPTDKMVKIVDFCGVRSGRKVDKIKHFNLELEPGVTMSTPSLKDCPISLECKVVDIIPLGTHHLFLGEVMGVNVEENLIDNSGKINFEKANVIWDSHGEYFKVNNTRLGCFGYSVRKKKKK